MLLNKTSQLRDNDLLLLNDDYCLFDFVIFINGILSYNLVLHQYLEALIREKASQVV